MTTPFIKYTYTDGDTSKFEFNTLKTSKDLEDFAVVKKPLSYGEYKNEDDAIFKLEFNSSTTQEDVKNFFITHIEKHVKELDATVT